MDYVLRLSLGVKRNKNGIVFGFKLPTELQKLPREIQHKKRIFIMTIAVFETINYWYWHDPPTIIFNREYLIDVLENGITHIDWTSYQERL